MPRRPPAPPTKVPAALATRVAAEVTAKSDRATAAAREDVALIRRRRADITEGFFEIGEALARLKAKGAKALGYDSFAALCTAELDLSLTHADRLVSLVTRVGRSDAVRLGQDRSAALIELSDAIPKGPAPTALESARLKLPDGKTFRVDKATTRQIREAAKAIRAARPDGKASRGRTTTVEERAFAATLQARLREKGLAAAKVTVVATRAGHPADLRIAGVAIDAVAKLRAALGGR